MDDLVKLYKLSENLTGDLARLPEDWMVNLRSILWGTNIEKVNISQKQQHGDVSVDSPQQSKKRVKCLKPINQEIDEASELLHAKLKFDNNIQANTKNDQKKPNEVLIPKDKENLLQTKDDGKLMPPPNADVTLTRTKKVAKLKVESNVKEPSLKVKIQRPYNNKIKLEHEQRPSQFSIQNVELQNSVKDPDDDWSSEKRKSSESIIAVPIEEHTVVLDNNSDYEDNNVSNDANVGVATSSGNKTKDNKQEKRGEINEIKCQQISIKIKREKLSGDLIENTIKPNSSTSVVTKDEEANVNLSNRPNISGTNKDVKKTRKKKTVLHIPIKVERFSDCEVVHSPVASRTRKGSNIRTQTQVAQFQRAINEQKIEFPDQMMITHKKFNSSCGDSEGNEQVSNLLELNNASMSKISSPKLTLATNGESKETISADVANTNSTFCTKLQNTVSQKIGNRSTFVVGDNVNGTLTKSDEPVESVADATFNVEKTQSQEDDADYPPSFETAKGVSLPNDNSLITEDESYVPDSHLEPSTQPTSKARDINNFEKFKAMSKMNKIPSRTNELFNPLIQSPVKIRVEAFENAAAAVVDCPPKRVAAVKKSNLAPTSITPTFCKTVLPAVGRFLTPNQGSTITPNALISKKQTNSASKAGPVLKSLSSSNLKGSTSSKTLLREKSAEDFRKGLQSMAEDRKKQREQKHLLAAQQREARERERAERIAKLAKEREEKRIKRQQEQEQKKRELEEIHRKIRLQEEVAAASEAAKLKTTKSKAILQQERDLLKKMSKQEMLPPPPKILSKYNFNMLQEDDSTDEEGKTSYKRPPPPNWSRSHIRDTAILMQQHMPTDVIDSFFSVQPMTPDLKSIFPNIDPRYLKRNSSAMWSTPPRYSQLPKY